MEIETLNAMNYGIYLSLLMMIEVIALMTVLLAVAGLVIHLAGIARFCFEETRPGITAPPTTWKSAPRAPDAQGDSQAQRPRQAA